MLCCLFQRSLRFYTEIFVAGNNFKNIFCLLLAWIDLKAPPLGLNSLSRFFRGAKDYSTVFKPTPK